MQEPSHPPTPDVFDTDHCPVGFRCEICGDATDGMAPVTSTTPLGVLCLTACPRCAESDLAPPVSIGTAVKLVAQHCTHLGITSGAMRDALEQ
jgi:hypothetical protein